MSAIWVFLGGGIGSIVRYFLGILFSKTTLTLPIATLSANIISCLIFGISLWLFNAKLLASTNLRLFLLTGICGGLSTFSTFSHETFELLKQQNYGWASANILLSLFLCVLIFYIFIGKLS
ncbi:MAG TPA: fluoride efflux transporter CrcB [Bacteroidia bacterium]|jgi:CrcB protein|nr:fluoride efflux transporter CrcB [Bacteroidia bacterium]